DDATRSTMRDVVGVQDDERRRGDAAARAATPNARAATTPAPSSTRATLRCHPGCGSLFARLPMGLMDAAASARTSAVSNAVPTKGSDAMIRDHRSWRGVTPMAASA